MNDQKRTVSDLAGLTAIAIGILIWTTIMVGLGYAATAQSPTVSGITDVSASADDSAGTNPSGLTGPISFYCGEDWIGDSAPATDGELVHAGGFAWDTTLRPNGPCALNGRATDVAGNTGRSADTNLDVQNPDNTAPTVTILEP